MVRAFLIMLLASAFCGITAPEESPEARLFKGGAAPMKGENGKWGFRSADGGWLVEPKFTEVRNYAEELAAVREGGSWGYLGTDGTWKIPARFSWAGDFSDGLAPASEGTAHREIRLHRPAREVASRRSMNGQTFP